MLAGGDHDGGANSGLLTAPAEQEQRKRKGLTSVGVTRKVRNVTLACCFKWAF